MTRLIGRELSLPPRPLALALAVADEPGFCFLWSADGSGPSYIACHPVGRATSLDPEPDLAIAPRAGVFASMPRWIGLLPYEAMRFLERPAWSRAETRLAPHVNEPMWHRYGAVAVVTDRVFVVGDDPPSIRRLSELLKKPAARGAVHAEALAVEPDAAHRLRIERAMSLIAQGHIYAINLARRLDLKMTGRAVDWLAALSATARAPYAAAFQDDDLTVVSSSPELCLALNADRRMWTAPIKGTRPRGQDWMSDTLHVRALATDPKEHAELWMIVDVERNDLGRVARPGSVRVVRAPYVETHTTVHHRLAVVGARLRDDASREDLLRAMLPSGSVTGAPKVRAMEVIAELEAARRGLYTGAFGLLRHDGGLRLAMAIRTLTGCGGVGHYWAGGGIVADSDPEREVVETRWKAIQVQRLLEGFRRDEASGREAFEGPPKVGLAQSAE